MAGLQWLVDLPAKWAKRAIWRSASTALIHFDASLKRLGAMFNNREFVRGHWSVSQ
jgi:hypothetical protein